MVENLSADYLITQEQTLAFVSKKRPIEHPHIVDALVAAGAFDDRSAAPVKILHSSSPYYVRYQAPDLTETVQLALEVRGAPALAHLKARMRQRLLPESVIEDMEEVDLFGIEHGHRDHAPEDREAVDRIAKRPDLWVFGSSDYHGTDKSNCIGENLTTPAITDEAVERVHLEVLHP